MIGAVSSNVEVAILAQRIDDNIAAHKFLEAGKKCNEAMQVVSSTLGKNSMAAATILDKMGQIEIQQANYDAAVIHESKALSIADGFLEPNSLTKAEFMDHLAIALKNSGKKDEAEKYEVRSLALKNSALIRGKGKQKESRSEL
jgi:stage V sporulation protein SpoVS